MPDDKKVKKKTSTKRSRKKSESKSKESSAEQTMVQDIMKQEPAEEAVPPEKPAEAQCPPAAQTAPKEKKRVIQAIGLIETIGLVPAIEAADAMCKAADVRLKGIEKVGAGLVTVKVRGDVSAVQASVSSGRAAAERLGQIVSVHVIPRPSEQTENIL